MILIARRFGLILMLCRSGAGETGARTFYFCKAFHQTLASKLYFFLSCRYPSGLSVFRCKRCLVRSNTQCLGLLCLWQRLIKPRDNFLRKTGNRKMREVSFYRDWELRESQLMKSKFTFGQLPQQIVSSLSENIFLRHHKTFWVEYFYAQTTSRQNEL